MAPKPKPKAKAKEPKSTVRGATKGLTVNQRTFLDLFENVGSVLATAKLLPFPEGVRASHYHSLRDNPEYKAAFEEAKRRAVDLLRAEAFRRAVDGTPRLKFNPKTGKPYEVPTYNEEGEVVKSELYIEREYSDTLLIRLLEAGAPDEFKQRQHHEHSFENLTDSDLDAELARTEAEIAEGRKAPPPQVGNLPS